MEWKDRELEVMNDIYIKSDDVKVPDSLLPENMMKKIEKEEREKENNKISLLYRIKEKMIGKCWFVSAAAMALCGIIVVATINLKDSKSVSYNLQNANSESDKKSNVYTYKKISEMLNEVNEYNVKDYLIGGDIVVDEEYEGESVNDNSKFEVNGYQNDVDNSDMANASTTNVQVEGIDEADVVKNDGKKIYILSSVEKKISIFDLKTNKILSTIDLRDENEELLNYYHVRNEMYICDDMLVYIGEDGNNTCIYRYDISDARKPVLYCKNEIEGCDSTTRLKDGHLYIIAKTNIFGDITEENCVPRLDGEQLEEDCVYFPDKVDSTSYVTATIIDLKKKEISDTIAISSNIGYNNELYMSHNNIYVSNYCDGNTDIWRVSYDNEKFGEPVLGRVKGRVYGQFAFDEYDGYLRVGTTYDSYESGKFGRMIYDAFDIDSNMARKNNIYVLDMDMKIVGSVEGFAKTESIYSVRYDGDVGYYVTFRNTDPLFKVDFSNPKDPKIVGELEMPGYSDYMHQWSKNKMLGLGYTGDNSFLKMSMFDVKDAENMNVIDETVFDNNLIYSYSCATVNHKMILINPEKNILGFEHEESNMEGERYYYSIYAFENNKFVEKLKVQLLDTMQMEKLYSSYDGCNVDVSIVNWDVRGVYIDDKLYIVVPGKEILVYEIDDYSLINKIKM